MEYCSTVDENDEANVHPKTVHVTRTTFGGRRDWATGKKFSFRGEMLGVLSSYSDKIFCAVDFKKCIYLLERTVPRVVCSHYSSCH